MTADDLLERHYAQQRVIAERSAELGEAQTAQQAAVDADHAIAGQLVELETGIVFGESVVEFLHRASARKTMRYLAVPQSACFREVNRWDPAAGNSNEPRVEILAPRLVRPSGNSVWVDRLRAAMRVSDCTHVEAERGHRLRFLMDPRDRWRIVGRIAARVSIANYGTLFKLEMT